MDHFRAKTCFEVFQVFGFLSGRKRIQEVHLQGIGVEIGIGKQAYRQS